MPSIAIVDDDTQIVALIEDMLDGEGYDVVSYRDSQTALHQIKARAPDDGDGPEARIISALADDVGNPLVAPEQGDLMNEMSEEFVEIGVGS